MGGGRNRREAGGAGDPRSRDIPAPASVAGVWRQPRFLLVMAVSIVLIVCIGLTGGGLHRWGAAEIIRQHQQEQLLSASQQAARLSEMFSHLMHELAGLASREEVRTLDEQRIRPLLKGFYHRHSDFVVCASFQDATGVVRYVEGLDVSGEGERIADQAHFRRAMAEQRPVVSGSFLAVEGYVGTANAFTEGVRQLGGCVHIVANAQALVGVSLDVAKASYRDVCAP